MSSQNFLHPNTNQSHHHHLNQQQHLNTAEESDIVDNADTVTRSGRAIDLAVHGVIVFLSVYAFGSITSAMQFQSPVGYTSSAAVFLFLVTGVSFVISLLYAVLGWWSQSPRGVEQISRHLQQQNMNDEVATKQLLSPPPSRSVRIVAFLVSNRPRFWIQVSLAVLCILSASIEANKIRALSDCGAVSAQYHHFCSTSKAAVASTFLSGFCWVAWAGWSYFFKSRQTPASSDTTDNNDARNGEVLISMPDERRVAEMSEVSTGVSRGSVGPALNQLVSDSQNNDKHLQKNGDNQSQSYVPPLAKHQQQDASKMAAINTGSDNSFGLGIDIGTKNASGVESKNEENGNSNLIGSVQHSQGNLNRFHHNSLSLSGINQITSSIPNGRTRSNSIRSVGTQSTTNINARLRDHAKVFQAPRSSASSVYEGYGGRGTPMMRSASRDFPPGSAYSLHRANKSFSSNVSTPTTPLTRGEMGYMGVHTMKAFSSVPRSLSMSHNAAFNSMSASVAGSAAPSAHASPIFGMNSSVPPQGGFEPSGTPVSARSQFGPSYFGQPPQTPAEAEAAELNMDEHLKAIRRRTASVVINSPLSINGENLMLPGAPSPAVSSHGSFRASFSSPNLGSYRRRSSLGLKSVLNSIVPSIARSDSSSSVSSSEVSSPRSPASPRESGSANVDGRSSLENQGNSDALSAEELLRLEYGGLLAQRSIADLTLGTSQTGGQQTLINDPATPRPSRPRSSSVSSDSTTKTGSSGYSDSTSSTRSNTTLTSVDEKRAARAAGPPRAFMNRIKIGHHKKSASSQQKLPSKGSNGSTNEITVTIPRSTSSDNFSWDYRREMPVD
ncbi:hypothetical protein BGZ76_010454 [Entomortierella beljakovae]|nr:hypothetical protein BGZ76_010454 [Entomortierella beljakovae]